MPRMLVNLSSLSKVRCNSDMIIGIGVDTVQISRMAHSLTIPNFIQSTFTQGEIDNLHGDEATYYATRFACKEAVFKAIGEPKDWRLIEILNDEDGKPVVSGFEGYNIHISVTTEAGLATAFCVVEK